MKFKLDENLGLLGKSLLESEGHDVMTIAEQNLSGAQDEHIYERARVEHSRARDRPDNPFPSSRWAGNRRA